MNEKVLEAYSDGMPLGRIVEKFNVPYKRIKDILHTYKEQSRKGRTFTDEFKQMIAERDMRGVTRKDISEELEINTGTVKKACEQFGQAIKEKASSDNQYTLVDVKDLSKCPSCDSKKVNKIDSMAMNQNTEGIFCKNCGDEHFYFKVYEDDKHVRTDIYKVNFEYLNED